MEFLGWVSDNWFNILTILFGSGVWFAALSIYKDAKIRKEEVKAQKVANLLSITASHREVWGIFLDRKELERVRDTAVNPLQEPITHAERVFVNLVIQHLNCVYYAKNDQLVVEHKGLRRDIAQFFSLPIPRAVWDKIKHFQNEDFATFVDSCLMGK